MRATLLIDHDNVPYNRVTIRTIIESWLDGTQDAGTGARYVDIRAYGGWFEEASASGGRFAAAEFYQQHCPSVMLHHGVVCHLTFAFADKLLSTSTENPLRDSGPFISHTLALRSTPLNVHRRGTSVCGEVNCELSNVKKWIKKKRACLKPACPHSFEEFFGRYEQKQVDVHIATDLLRACRSGIDDVVLVSEDWDLLPALLSGAADRVERRRLVLIRFRESTSYLDTVLAGAGVRIVMCPSISEATV